MRPKERFVVFENKGSKRRCCIFRDEFGRRAVCCLQAGGKGVWQQRGGQSNPGPCRRIRIRTGLREPSHPEHDSHHHHHHHKEERCTAK